MSSPSEEIWENFDALCRRVNQLARRVKDLEARLEGVERIETPPALGEFESGSISLYEGEIRR